MYTKANIAGHPIHPMLIVFPLGLLIFSFICQIIFLATRTQQSEVLGVEVSIATTNIWQAVALYTMGGGIISALIAAVPGFIDFLSLPESRAKTIGTYHMALNLTAVVIFAIAYYLTYSSWQNYMSTFVLSIIGVAILFVSGALGGTLIYQYCVAVSDKCPILRPA